MDNELLLRQFSSELYTHEHKVKETLQQETQLLVLKLIHVATIRWIKFANLLFCSHKIIC